MSKPVQETWPCSGGCGTMVTTIWDGKMHYCDVCTEAAMTRAEEYWAAMSVPVPVFLAASREAWNKRG